MQDLKPRSGGSRDHPRHSERRKHPRMTCVDTAAAGVPTTFGRDRPLRPSLLRRLLVGLGLRATARDAPRYDTGSGLAAHRARLPALIVRLEAVLAELDAMQAWREAVDVCSAIESLKARAREAAPAPAAGPGFERSSDPANIRHI